MKVKICGLTDPNDAAYAAKEGADYVGIIFFAGSKRHVALPLAKEIAESAKQGGAKPVAVFVNETVDQMQRICEQTGIDQIQLHGPLSQSALDRLLEEQRFSIIYTISVDIKGIPAQQGVLNPSIISLYDTLSGGTGQTFDWTAFTPPEDPRWILAGGLNPENVGKAITLLKPYGVDTASGVEFPGSTRKDPHLVHAFIQEAKSNYRRKQ